METLNKMLDNAVTRCSRPSDRALAEALKVTPTTVSEWRKGSRVITNGHLAQVAKLAQASPAEVAAARLELADSKDERAMWASLLDQLRPIAAAVGLLALGMAGNVAGTHPAQAHVSCTESAAHARHYAQSRRRRGRAFTGRMVRLLSQWLSLRNLYAPALLAA